jgi:hypothetical protein
MCVSERKTEIGVWIFPDHANVWQFCICLNKADIAWVHGSLGHFCIGETAADSSDAIAACQRRCSASMQQHEV